MKGALQTLVLIGTLLSSIEPVLCRVNFSSRDSALKVGSKGRFNITSSNFEVDGTLATKQGAAVSGNEFFFSDGILENNGTEVLMTATYIPTGSDSIALRGNGRFKVEPGTVIHQLTVLGEQNRLEGQPLFKNPINLTDSTTSLTIAIQNKLNNDINLRNGRLQLDDDLILADNTHIKGPGRIALNRRTLGLGGFYSKPWASPLVFDAATDLSLNGSVVLTSSWTFNGINNLQGNGTILDLSLGGSLVIPSDSLLYINDLYIRGLGNGNLGKIVFGGPTSAIRTSNVFIEFDNTYNFTTGGIYVDGATTFVMKENDLYFEQDAKLTVDRTTLWLDVPNDFDCSPGALRAPLPVFVGHVWNNANVTMDIALGNLELLGTGTIKEIADKSLIAQELIDEGILCGSVTTTVVLNNSFFVPCDRIIKIDANVCIEGCCQAIYFTNKSKPQFVVSEGVTVCLRNIILSNINNVTFDLRPGARINIENCVAFEFSEDVTFSTNLIKVLDEPGFNIFTLRGLNGRRKVKFNSINPVAVPTLLDIQDNTLLLESVELSGFDFITHNDTDVSGAVALSGDAAVDIDNDTDMNFVAEGVDNDMNILADEVTLSGAILFAECPCNSLKIKTAIPDVIQDKEGVTSGNPLLILDGNPGLFVTSDEGIASVIFDDLSLSVRNANDNAFVVDAHSLLNCKRLEILGNPIKQSSTEFKLEAIELFGQKIDPSFIRSPLNRAFYGHVPVTALHLMRERERELFEASKQELQQQHLNEKQRPLAQKHKKKRKKRDYEGVDQELIASALTKQTEETRKPKAQQTQKASARNTCPNIPASFDTTYENSVFDATTNVVGNIRVRTGGITNFSLGAAPANITLEGRSFINQGAQDVVFDTNQFLNIRGKDNRLKVTRKVTLGSGFCFEKGGQLIVEFDNSGDQQVVPTVIVPRGVILSLPAGAELNFVGAGEVIFQDEAGFFFDGVVQPSTNVQELQQDCSILKDTRSEQLRFFADKEILQRPRLFFSNGALLTLEVGATAAFEGVGFIGLINASKIVLNKPSLLRLGNELTDDIKLVVLSDSEIRIHDESGLIGGGPAILGFHGGTESMSFENGGHLFVGRKGVLEINAQGPRIPGPNPQVILRRGNLQMFDIGNGGSMFIDGILRVGLNDVDPILVDPVTSIVGTGHNFLWRAVDGEIKSTNNSGKSIGLIQFIGKTPSVSFTGRLNVRDTEEVFTYGDQVTAERFVQLLTQQDSDLEHSTLFIDSQDRRVLRTVLGVSVLLKDGDIILGESGQVPNVQVNGRDASGKSFVIGSNGTRS